MLADKLAHIITHQLRQEPLVVLPGFGGFLKDELSASLDEMRNRIHPPKNTVVFNAKLAHNDGFLLAEVAQQLEVSYSDADNWLTDAISEIRFSLNNGESVVLEGLGVLTTTIDGVIEFEAVETPNVQDEFFGLKPVSLNQLEKDNVDKVREFVATDGPVATKVRTLPFGKIAKYAAAAVAAGFLMWMPIQQGVMNNGKMLVHELNPFAVTSKAAYESRTYNEDWITKGFEQQDVLADKFNHEYLKLQLTDNTDNIIVVKTDAVPSNEVELEPDAPEETLNESASSFKVIAATFSSKNDAADHVAKMIKRGFSAEYAGKDSQGHMVAYGTYNSLEDAERMLRSVSISNKQARIVSAN